MKMLCDRRPFCGLVKRSAIFGSDTTLVKLSENNMAATQFSSSVVLDRCVFAFPILRGFRPRVQTPRFVPFAMSKGEESAPLTGETNLNCVYTACATEKDLGYFTTCLSVRSTSLISHLFSPSRFKLYLRLNISNLLKNGWDTQMVWLKIAPFLIH